MSASGASSPYRRHRNDDLESGGGFDAGPFDIVSTKSVSIDRIKRWRRAALVLNAPRRYIYTLDLKKEEEKKQTITKIRTDAQVIRAAYLFQAAGALSNVSGAQKVPPSPIPTGGYDIGPEQLASMTREHDYSALHSFRGVRGLSDKLKTNLEKGIPEEESNILLRINVFGSNTYPRKKGKRFWRFLFDDCRHTTLIILMVAAAASLGLGIKTEGIKEGWQDGGSIALAVIIVIVVTAISDYRQSLLNEEKQNIHLEVTRGARRVDISIIDIVVGDVLPLRIGDQVPAAGILISGDSLAIDEPSMTGESKIVHKDLKAPFMIQARSRLVSNCTARYESSGLSSGRSDEEEVTRNAIPSPNGQEGERMMEKEKRHEKESAVRLSRRRPGEW